MFHFIWDDWNEDHIAEHGVRTEEAEEVVETAKRPFPRSIGSGKYLVRGQSKAGRFLQVIYARRSLHTIDLNDLDPQNRLILEDGDEIAYVLHARDLSRGEKRGIRR